jgi:RNA polymerase sigma-70 factor (ECF subfamily)
VAHTDHLTYDASPLSFETTRWSLVLAAAGSDSQAARDALASLCETYWYPLYAYLRRRGLDPEDARDLTQGFLTSLIERQDFEGLRQERGRFRAFLLASLKHYLSNWSARERTQKRGGGRRMVPLENAEGQYVVEPTDHATPETLFERRWALTVVDGLLADLRAQWTAQGRASEFDELKACLLGQAPAGGYAAAAIRLGTSAGAVKAAVHRLRRRFQSLLRERVAETVADGRDVDDEIRHLIHALSA